MYVCMYVCIYVCIYIGMYVLLDAGVLVGPSLLVYEVIVYEALSCLGLKLLVYEALSCILLDAGVLVMRP